MKTLTPTQEGQTKTATAMYRDCLYAVLPRNAASDAAFKFAEKIETEHTQLVAIVDQVSRYLTGDCRAGDLTHLESVICDVEGLRAKLGLDRSALASKGVV